MSAHDRPHAMMPRRKALIFWLAPPAVAVIVWLLAAPNFIPASAPESIAWITSLAIGIATEFVLIFRWCHIAMGNRSWFRY